MNPTKTVEILRKVAKKSKSKLAKGLLEDQEYQAAKSVAYQLFDEMLEQFCDGDMSWKEAVGDLKENLLALEMPKPDHGEDDGENYGD